MDFFEKSIIAYYERLIFGGLHAFISYEAKSREKVLRILVGFFEEVYKTEYFALPGEGWPR